MRKVSKAIAVTEQRASVCKPAICFVLDGSDEVTGLNWEAQVSFVQLVSAIVGAIDGALFSAVEFTEKYSVNELSPLQTFTGFAVNLATATPTGLVEPNLRGAMEYCTQLLEENVGGTAFQKIVTLADLDTLVRGKKLAVDIAREWDGDDVLAPKPFNDMCGGVIGSGSKKFWVKLAGGIRTDVRRVASWPLLIDIIVDLIEDICGPIPN